MEKLYNIADEADVIIDGFAFSRGVHGIRVFNLNNGKGAAEFMEDGTMIETNMDDIELVIAKEHLAGAMKYMGD